MFQKTEKTLGNKINHDDTNEKLTKKKKITYDDILQSLHLKVNNGKLEFIPPSSASTPQTQLLPPSQNNYDQFKTCYRKQEMQHTQQNNTPNSYIHNKYFKETTANSQPEEPQPIYMNPREYRRHVLLEMLRIQEERKRISEIKSNRSYVLLASFNAG